HYVLFPVLGCYVQGAESKLAPRIDACLVAKQKLHETLVPVRGCLVNWLIPLTSVRCTDICPVLEEGQSRGVLAALGGSVQRGSSIMPAVVLSDKLGTGLQQFLDALDIAGRYAPMNIVILALTSDRENKTKRGQTTQPSPVLRNCNPHSYLLSARAAAVIRL